MHGRLARALQRGNVSAPDLIAHHFVEAGEPERAAHHAAQAAERAHDSLAFERAVYFYRIALSVATRGGDPQYSYGLRVRLGDALSACSRSPEAAEAYLSAASVLGELNDETGARDLRVRAANCLLESGHGTRGASLLGAELKAVGIGMPRTRAQTMMRLGFNMLRQRIRGLGFSRRNTAEIAPQDLIRIDACAAAAIGLAGVDYVRSAYFQSLFLRLSLETGDLSRIGKALAREGMYTAMLRADAESPEAIELMRVVDEIASELQEQPLLALAEYLRATQRYSAGRFHQALPLFRNAREIMGAFSSEIRGELITLQQVERTSMQHVGLWSELSERVDEDLRSARERGDLFTTAYLQLALSPLLALARDDVLTAEEHISYGPQHEGAASIVARDLLSDFSTVALRLYTGRHEGLARWGLSRWKVWRDAWIIRVPMLRVEGLFIQLRAVLGELSALSELPRELVAEVSRLSAELDKVRLPYGCAYANLGRASLALLHGQTAAAVELLERAEGELEACGMFMLAHVARLRRGQVRGAEGQDIHAAAEQAMRGQAIKYPQLIAQIYVPVRRLL